MQGLQEELCTQHIRVPNQRDCSVTIGTFLATSNLSQFLTLFPLPLSLLAPYHSGKHLKMLLDSPVMSNVSHAVSGMVSGGSGSGTFGGYGSGSGGGGTGVGGGIGGGTLYNVSLR